MHCCWVNPRQKLEKKSHENVHDLIPFFGRNEIFKLLQTAQIKLVCQNVLSTYNLKNVKLYDKAVSWHIAAIVIRAHSDQKLHIWTNWMYFSRSQLFSTLPLGWLYFRFNVITMHPWFINSWGLFEQIWIVVERRQHLLSDIHATLFLLKI